MTTCDWHIDGGTVKCGMPALRVKVMGAHLCDVHHKEYLKRWGPNAIPGYASEQVRLESERRRVATPPADPRWAGEQ